jgi:hypothetical protein
MAKPKDVTDGLQMMAKEFRLNAERSMSSPQQMAMAGRAMIAEGGANEITRLRRQNDELREALKPFAGWINDLDLEFADHEDDIIVAGRGEHVVTFGDLRRARALASQEEKQDSTPGEAQNPISKPLG